MMTSNPSNAFDAQLEADADVLAEMGVETLADEEVQGALNDPEHNDEW